MLLKRNFFYYLVLIMASFFFISEPLVIKSFAQNKYQNSFQNVSTNIPPKVSLDKIYLQSRLKELLYELDAFSGKKINSLYSDQSKRNICKHAQYYKRADQLITEFTENLYSWKKLVQRNPNDKVYQVFSANAQLGLYSIYSRFDEFLTFLKLYTKDQENIFCESVPKQIIPEWYEKYDEWQRQSESLLIRAQASINKALKIDEDYADAKILKAELLALQGHYKDAQVQFENLEEDGLFLDNRSFLNSWKAYIEIKLKNIKDAKIYLKKASAFSEPYESSNWASLYLKNLNVSASNWGHLDHKDFQPAENVDLERLKEKMKITINDIRKTLKISMNAMPRSVNGVEFGEYALSNRNIFLEIETDKSPQNLRKYSKFIQRLYDDGEKLEKIISKWDRLSKINEDISHYYLLNKITCEMIFLKMVNATQDIVNDPSLKYYFGKRIDYKLRWNEWEQDIKSSLSSDIARISSVKEILIPVQIVLFEYQAMFGNPQKALLDLDEITKKLKKYKLMVFSEDRKVDITAYAASWKSYLALKDGQEQRAKRFLNDANGFKGLTGWKNDQDRIIYLQKALKPKETKR